jgi:hypothetical protein
MPVYFYDVKSYLNDSFKRGARSKMSSKRWFFVFPRRAARDGANVAIAAKTDTPHPKLEGTLSSSAKAIEQAGSYFQRR